MSLEMVIEADERLTQDQVGSALVKCGAELVERQSGGALEAFFPSGMSLWSPASEAEYPEVFATMMPLGSEQPEMTFSWNVGMRLTFRLYTPDLDQCDAELHGVIEELARSTESYFVLSFQQETIYAVRDSLGLRDIKPRWGRS